MAHNRKRSLDNISYYISVLQADLKIHQPLNDLSLNMKAENYFRDVLRFVRKWDDLENLNFFEPCAKSVDLISEKNKRIIQVTSTTTSTKLYASLEALEDSKYKDYSIEILYLLDIPNFKPSTVQSVLDDYGIHCEDVIFDTKKLIREIENLEEKEILQLEYDFFSDRAMRYTDNIVLQIACKSLVDKMPYTSSNKKKSYKIDQAKLKISDNKLDDTIIDYSKLALDYTWIVSMLDNQDLVRLHNFVVNDIYVNCLLNKLHKEGFTLSDISDRSFTALNKLCAQHDFDMTDVINSVQERIRQELIVKDFNGIYIPWVIVFTFFEICDIGYLKEVGNADA